MIFSQSRQQTFYYFFHLIPWRHFYKLKWKPPELLYIQSMAIFMAVEVRRGSSSPW